MNNEVNAKKSAEEVVRAEDLTKYYYQKNDQIFSRKKKIIKSADAINFTLHKGEVLGLIGESGCGKSTIGRILVGLEDPTRGKLYINGKEASKLLKTNEKEFRRSVQMVFQNPFDTFTPKHTIEKVLTRAMEIHNIGSSSKERYEMCEKALEDAGLKPAEDFLKRYPHELSGGQLQRISILRSMFLKPSFMVADEPVSMLDVSVRAEIINMLQNLVKNNDTALVFISHDITITRYISDKIAVMYLGRIVEMGESDEIIKNPQHPYTQVLISNCASIDFENREKPIKINGEPPTPINPGPGCYFAPRCFKATKECFEKYPEFTDLGNGHIASCFNMECSGCKGSCQQK